MAKKINSAVFPGQQGGPLMHAIAGKAVAFKIAASEEFKERQERTLEGARILAERLIAADVVDAGVSVLTGGTDVHLVLVDLRNSQLDGKQAEDLLHEVGITVNRNAVPFDPRPPMVTSGLRIGTPALATRGFGDDEFTEVAEIIATALQDGAATDVAGPARPASTSWPRPSRSTPAWSSGKPMTAPRFLTARPRPPRSRPNSPERVAALKAKGIVPGLGTVLVGEDPGRQWYVGGKHKDCAEVGIQSIRRDLPETTTQEELLAVIAELNANPECTGYIVQLPLPKHIDQDVILEAMDPAKDADGLHPMNLGRLVANVNRPMTSPLPCTPKGCVVLMERHGIDLNGKRVVVVGRGVTIGRPIGLLLTRRDVNATVVLAHTGTADLAAELRRADVVIAAAGVPHMIKADGPQARRDRAGRGRVPRRRRQRQGRGDRRRRPGRRRRRRLAVAEPGRRGSDDPRHAAGQRGRGRRAPGRGPGARPRRRGLAAPATPHTATEHATAPHRFSGGAPWRVAQAARPVPPGLAHPCARRACGGTKRLGTVAGPVQTASTGPAGGVTHHRERGSRTMDTVQIIWIIVAVVVVVVLAIVIAKASGKAKRKRQAKEAEEHREEAPGWRRRWRNGTGPPASMTSRPAGPACRPRRPHCRLDEANLEAERKRRASQQLQQEAQEARGTMAEEQRKAEELEPTDAAAADQPPWAPRPGTSSHGSGGNASPRQAAQERCGTGGPGTHGPGTGGPGACGPGGRAGCAGQPNAAPCRSRLPRPPRRPSRMCRTRIGPRRILGGPPTARTRRRSRTAVSSTGSRYRP